MWQKIVYVLAWSLGLLFATFPDIFDCTQKFGWTNEVLSNASSNFYFPFIMVMELFLFDAIYSFVLEQSKNGIKNVIPVMVLFSSFLLFFALSMFFSEAWMVALSFAGGWLSLTAMKLFTTQQCTPASKTMTGSIDNKIEE